MFFGKSTVVAAIAALTFATAAPSLEKKDQNSGTATYYAAGLGACGWTNSGSDYVVAVNSAQYDGSKCGSKLWVWNPATSTIAFPTVADECPSCNSGDLDMSEGLFGHLTNNNFDLGVFEMQWGYL
ncbi:hypothetical protein L486_05827 [Kwoniella mangroviensis CBS 10435]|uniref:Barwin domain-containing protein n=1 Tax=Kwoniella mangroviensis CBS 10435 TaxID=1331196 RepID=A0A1B9INF3_9TREE|nr:uncharacterized protein I203_03102 [Kwoniella mangroviensis CBS 8507]OCF56971.1 hypothetical protein L486_05827 [Kwoniella mangroviensis CBS 10435]OCF67408.1 hypothetical protein I203_03102 [Kwoniella mangroviensis CBS 8507]OCF75543.1 hypothetical protein I204_04399 [Kwoniella mangroviensis CBS 8886]